MGLLDTIVQSAVLSLFSNILAQIITSYQKDLPLTHIHFTPVVQFVVYAILNTPINVAWQSWLESNYPSTKRVAKKEKADVKVEESLDVKNTAIKFLLDQTVGAAFNIPLYFAILGALKGQSADYIINAIKANSLDIYFSGMKLWPPVSLISFAFIPAEHRVIFGSIAGVIWNIYLSLMAQ